MARCGGQCSPKFYRRKTSVFFSILQSAIRDAARVIDAVIKSFRKIWFITQDQDSNVTRILTPNISVAPQNHFKRVMYEASEFLLCVVLELRQK
jgi:hypothetical protein